MNKEFHFSEEFGNIDEKLIAEAGKEWTGKTYAFQLYRRRIAGAVAILLLCIIAAGNAGVQAAVKEFTTKIGELLGFTKDLASYTEVINQTQTQNGISFTLNEVILDDRTLLVSVKEVLGESGESHPIWINEEKTTINGKNYESYSSASGAKINPEALEELGMDTDIILSENYEDMILPEKGEVTVHLVLDAGKSEPEPGEEFESEAEFVYDFAVSPEELRAQTVKQKLDISISGENDRKLVLKELVMNDLYSRIVATGVTWDDEWMQDYELKLKGEDSFGNPVSLVGAGFASENEIRLETSLFGDYEAGESAGEDAFVMSVPDKNCEYLDLQLYERKIIWSDDPDESGADTASYETYYDDGEGSYAAESTDPGETYTREENYGWQPVGEKFRIYIGAQEDLASTAIIGGADAPAEILLP